MNRITENIHMLTHENPFISQDESHMIINFVNELKNDPATLEQIDKDSTELIMYHFENLVKSSNLTERIDEESQLEASADHGGQSTILSNPYFSQFKTSVGSLSYGLGLKKKSNFIKNVYNKSLTSFYVAAASALGMCSLFTSRITTLLSAQETRTTGQEFDNIVNSRIAIISASAIFTSLAGYFLVRRHLLMTQQDTNERFINAVKRVVKCKLRLNTLLSATRKKVISDYNHCYDIFLATKLKTYDRNSLMPSETPKQKMINKVEKLLFQVLANSKSLKSDIVNDGDVLIRLYVDGVPIDLSEEEFEIFNEIATSF